MDLTSFCWTFCVLCHGHNNFSDDTLDQSSLEESLVLFCGTLPPQMFWSISSTQFLCQINYSRILDIITSVICKLRYDGMYNVMNKVSVNLVSLTSAFIISLNILC
ncbi:hypothetical protein S245_045287 [Arachis hypogaea]